MPGVSMLRAIHIERYRGIRRCSAEGLGRVNLIVGKNDCGKTAFMEALQLADEGENAAHILLFCQRDRLGRTTRSNDFERFWQPMFFGLDAGAGFAVSVQRDDGATRAVEVRRGTVSDVVLPIENDDVRITNEDTLVEIEVVKAPTWVIDLWRTGDDRAPTRQQIVATSRRLRLPRFVHKDGGAWIHSGTTIGENEIKYVSQLMQRGQEPALLELLRAVDARVAGVQLLAPSGELAELFVRLEQGPPMLPLGLMGEAVQRCFEIAVASSGYDGGTTLYLDNIERGLHHAVLEPLWRWLATASRERRLQLFASTHSDECIRAAVAAFARLDDDGLRVLRLDRGADETVATIHDRARVEAARHAGADLRG